ncbi:MAG: hypothetical protein MI974_06355 [Chitinophagales bacterium]|nr:hypothetical protein [Chitinophagales bacterium]
MKDIDIIWVCPKDNSHKFKENTSTGLCPDCVEGFNILEARRESKQEEKADDIMTTLWVDAEEKFGRLLRDGDDFYELEDFERAREKYEQALAIFPDRNDVVEKIKACESQGEYYMPVISPIKNVPEDALGLCVLLMDASGSMFMPNTTDYEGMSKAQVVASAAAKGIMTLKNNSRAKRAYLAIYKFDHRVKLVCMKSVKDIIGEFETEEKLGQYLYSAMERDMGGETDINAALQTAYDLSYEFLNQDMKVFRQARDGKDYPIVMTSVSNNKTMDRVEVPNVRVFVYTDGMQYVDEVSDPLVNPFKGGGNLPDTPVDILLGAFIGASHDAGCKELKEILSDCPEHDQQQFFLIESSKDTVKLSGVFRMASGNSGFCKQCIEKINRQAGRINDHVIDISTVGDLLSKDEE